MVKVPVKTLENVKIQHDPLRTGTSRTLPAHRVSFADKLKKIRNVTNVPFSKKASHISHRDDLVETESLAFPKRGKVKRTLTDVKQILNTKWKIGDKDEKKEVKKDAIKKKRVLAKSDSGKSEILSALTLEQKDIPLEDNGKAKKNQAKNRSKQVHPGNKNENWMHTGTRAKIEIPNISSMAEKVEIVDKRTIPSVRRNTAGRRSLKGESAQSRPEISSDTVPASGDAKFAVMETEIGILKGNGIRVSDENAAEALARKLDTQAGNEIVRQVKVILNRAEAGEIRISLRPENLGRVRVSIQMEDNRLAGRIFVESVAAREAFRASLDGLQAKLVESGFNAADLELLLDEKSMNYQRGEGKHNFAGGEDSREKRENAIREFEVLAARSIDDFDGRINMVV